MAAKSDKKKSGRTPTGPKASVRSAEPEAVGAGVSQDSDELVFPGRNLIGPGSAAVIADETEIPSVVEMGTSKYVPAAFFSAGLLAAYVAAKMLLMAWNRLAEWPVAVKAARFLLVVGESERQGYTLVAGVLVGAIATLYTYRKEEVRHWADEVALELSKVTWPNRETVRNGTLVVLAASLVATVYVMLLDRFWGFLTSLIYET